MLTQTLFLSLTTFVLSLPTSPNPAIPLPESWLIPRLDEHVMSERTGLPGNNPWPESMQFNSTIDFDAILPAHAQSGDGAVAGNVTVNCKASFLNGTLPAEPVPCTGGAPDEVVLFEMKPYVREGRDVRPELSFSLVLTRYVRVSEAAPAYLSGEVAITANDGANTPSSYLTCLEGRPMDGLRCKIGSYMSVRNELFIQATSEE